MQMQHALNLVRRTHNNQRCNLPLLQDRERLCRQLIRTNRSRPRIHCFACISPQRRAALALQQSLLEAKMAEERARADEAAKSARGVRDMVEGLRALIARGPVEPSIDTGVGFVTKANFNDPAMADIVHPPLDGGTAGIHERRSIGGEQPTDRADAVAPPRRGEIAIRADRAGD